MIEREPEPQDSEAPPDVMGSLLEWRVDTENLFGKYAERYAFKWPIVEHSKPTAVFRVYDKKDGLNLVFKHVFKSNAIKEKAMLKKFESDLIVHYVDTIEDINQTYWFIILRFFDSVPLDQYLQGLKTEPKTRDYVDISDTMMRAIKIAHDAGIAHRDIKPDNFLVSKKGFKEGGLKLNDLGLARLLSNPASVSAGATGYRAPEAHKGGEDTRLLNGGKQTNSGIESDIYSTGVLLYELFKGDIRSNSLGLLSKSLFGAWVKDEKGNLTDLSKESLEALISNPNSYNKQALLPKKMHDINDPNINTKRDRLDSVIRRCLEYKPAERYHSAEALRFDMHLALDDPADGKVGYVEAVDAALNEPDSPGRLEEICRAYNRIIDHCRTSAEYVLDSELLKEQNKKFRGYCDDMAKQFSAVYIQTSDEIAKQSPPLNTTQTDEQKKCAENAISQIEKRFNNPQRYPEMQPDFIEYLKQMPIPPAEKGRFESWEDWSAVLLNPQFGPILHAFNGG